MLEVKNINKTYKSKKGTRCHAVRDISIDFGDKGLIFILGKSGSGKSTLLNLISGLDMADNGQIIIADKSGNDFKQSDFDVYRNTYVGFIFQDFSIIEDISVKENIALTVSLQGKTITDKEIADALKPVDLEGYENRKPNEMSGGQKQRVAIARALIKNPKIIFADEPTGNLDSKTSKQILDAFKQLSKDRLVIVVSHDTDSALVYADRIIELADGKVISDRTKTETLNLEQIKSEYQDKIDSCFIETVPQKTQKPRFERIKTHIPTGYAFRMSISSFGIKKFRFLFSMFISILALAIFCVALNIRSYDYYSACLATFEKLDINTIALTKYESLPEDADEDDKKNRVTTTFTPDGYGQVVSGNTTPFFKVYSYGLTIRKFRNPEDRTSLLDVESNYIPVNAIVESGSDNFDAGVLNNFYKSKLIEGAYPQPNPDCIEILISDFTADSCLLAGGVFSNGNVYPNAARKEFVGKRFLSNNVPFKIVGIFATDYQKTITAKKLDSPARFKKYYTYSRVLTAKNALIDWFRNLDEYAVSTSVAAETGDGTGVEFIMTGGEIERTVTFHFYKAESAALAVEKEKDFAALKVKFIDGYNQNTLLKECEMIVTLSKFSELNDLYSSSTVYTFDSLDFNAYAGKEYPVKLPGAVNSPPVAFSIVGIIDDTAYQKIQDVAVVSPATMSVIADGCLTIGGMYAAINPGNSGGNRALLQYFDNNDMGYFTYASSELRAFNELFVYVLEFFDVAALVLFALVFLVMYSFISSSINGKRHDIGILRAMGARGTDIAKVFAFEGLIVAAINLVFSAALTFLGVLYVNYLFTRKLLTSISIILIRPLSFLLLALTCIGVILIASAIPLFLIIRQRPVDSIKKI